MRKIVIGMSFLLLLFAQPTSIHASAFTQQTIIIEVEGDPHERAKQVLQVDQRIEIITTYDTLLDGIALSGRRASIDKIRALDFVHAIHPVTMYEAVHMQASPNSYTVFPSDVHTTSLTGAGVKVGVVDTGMDYTHPDLQSNYKGGYDVVDFDDDPMETPIESGLGTVHGTHVAGIIAANGEMQGVAPDAALYIYRALGPGGYGSSVQVIAAMEEAVKDGVDLLNLSLGNTINGPDFPTSIAVNKAEELGVLTVIANGNAGPDEWTIGSPATASNAFSVGAVEHEHVIATLYEPLTKTEIPIIQMIGAPTWDLHVDYPVKELTSTQEDVRGSIAIAKRDDEIFTDKAIRAERAGAVALLVYDEDTDDLFQGAIQSPEDTPITIPVASIARSDAEILIHASEPLFIETTYTTIPDRVAPFSSRGPVTMNWSIKPDIIAPGARIFSTIPGGYNELQGTSMAAPYVTGALALLKEARPNWTNEQLIAALETTAKRLEHPDGTPFLPIEQGMGVMDIDDAVDTEILIHGGKLSFGKMEGMKDQKTALLTIENLSTEEKTFSFSVPQLTKGIHWTLPMMFTVEPQTQKTVEITLGVTHLLEEGIHQGWLTLHQDTDEYYLPYLFIAEEADQPKVMGFDFHMDPFSESTYMYQLYVTEEADAFTVDLYDHESLIYAGTLLEEQIEETGLHKGTIQRNDVPYHGTYIAVLTMYLTSGEIDRQLMELTIISE